MLTRMKLGNFKSWKELDIELAPITVLFGTNSSGKSSVLQALLMLKQTANSFDRGQHINFGGGEQDYVKLGSYKDLIHSHDENNRLSIELTWGTSSLDNYPVLSNEFGSFDIRYATSFSKSKDEIFIDYLQYQHLNSNTLDAYVEVVRLSDTTYEYKIPTEFGFMSYDVYGGDFGTKPYNSASMSNTPESCYAIPTRLGPFERALDEFFTEVFTPINFNLQFEKFIGAISYLKPLRSYPERNYLWTGSTPQIVDPTGANAVNILIASERKRGNLLQQVSFWLNQLGILEEFSVQALDADKRFYEPQIKIGGVVSSLLDVGFGVSQVLPVITMLFFVPEGSIVLLEQPELHLHPSAQAKLADLFLHVAETRKLQLIVESHSEHLLTRLQRRVAEPEYTFATPENIKTYFCTMTPEGSQIQSVQIDEYGQIQNYPANFFGDISGDLDALTDAALARRREELSRGG